MRAPRCSTLVDVPEYESPDAPSTTVLVTGATGRVGRVLVRKLLLRGYKVGAAAHGGLQRCCRRLHLALVLYAVRDLPVCQGTPRKPPRLTRLANPLK